MSIGIPRAKPLTYIANKLTIMSAVASLLITACNYPIALSNDPEQRDSFPPSAPGFLNAEEISPREAVLRWGVASDDVGVAFYEVTLNGNLLTETETNEFKVTQLKPDTQYWVSVSAIDETDKRSLPVGFQFKTLPDDGSGVGILAIDSQAPSVPQNLRATSVGNTHVTLYWTPSKDNIAVSAYQVFQNGMLLQTVDSARAQLSGLQSGALYGFKVAAVDSSGNVSAATDNVLIRTQALVSIATAHGPEQYALQCASCHGVDGSGVGTTVGVTRPLSLAELTTITEQTMPPDDPTLCVADCAAAVAQYIFDTFTTVLPPVTDPLAAFPEPAQQIADVCARAAAANRADAVVDTFCGATPAPINSLAALQASLGLAFNNPNATGRRGNGAGGNPSFALTGHSSSLVAQEVNAINPRAIIFTANAGRRGGGAPAAPNGFVAMGFVRGDLLAELIAQDRNTGVLNFYLLSYDIACSVNGTCSIGDLLTPPVESNWVSVNLFDEVNLANTSLDCLQCHQANGPASTKILLMQELDFPWSHWLRSNTLSSVLLDDFRAARGSNEAYAGIPANLITASDPRLLERLVRATGAAPQPNEFNSRRIEAQVLASAPGQPADNSVPGQSQTWNQLNAQTIAGNAIAVPYHDIKVTDPAVLPNLIQAYQNFLNGSITAAALPDLRDAFYTAQLPDIGFRVASGLSAPDIVQQSCAQCHNSGLDQRLTRARFNVDLNAMSDTAGGLLTGVERDREIGIAINRIQLPVEDVRAMPPKLFRRLDAAEIDAVITYLCAQTTGVISQCAGR